MSVNVELNIYLVLNAYLFILAVLNRHTVIGNHKRNGNQGETNQYHFKRCNIRKKLLVDGPVKHLTVHLEVDRGYPL